MVLLIRKSSRKSSIQRRFKKKKHQNRKPWIRTALGLGPGSCGLTSVNDLGYESHKPIGSLYAIYANIGGILMVNVTIYIAYMDPMGNEIRTTSTWFIWFTVSGTGNHHKFISFCCLHQHFPTCSRFVFHGEISMLCLAQECSQVFWSLTTRTSTCKRPTFGSRHGCKKMHGFIPQ
jgi:hypothetical protein